MLPVRSPAPISAVLPACIIKARIAAGSRVWVNSISVLPVALQHKSALFKSLDQKDAYNADNDNV